LRIAAIVSDQLFDGLRFEGELMLLTPANWRRTLNYGRPDLLLIESTWDTSTGHWYLAQNTPGEASAQLRALVSAFRGKGVPTAYWITADQAYHQHYREFATHFDQVFCADPAEAELLCAEGVSAEVLLPCVQPALYNPFRKHEEYDAMELGVLFDGWGDMDRKPEDYTVLEELRQESKLSIIESRYLLTHNRLRATETHHECILGCATAESRILALKYSKATISFEKTLSTPTTQCWEALQATASYCPAIHFGALPEADIRSGLVQAFNDDLDALVELVRMEEDDLYRQRIAHHAWRTTLQHHTFSHRIRQICELIGIRHDWEEYPKVSVITPTCRPDMVPQAIATYRKQSYPRRELILVYNGRAPANLPEEIQPPDVQVVQVPGDRFAGASLNIGSKFATGRYCFRLDDDDMYAEHYLLDFILANRCVQSDVMGKPMPPIFKFEGESEVYSDMQKRKPFCVRVINSKKGNPPSAPGNSIAFTAISGGGNLYRDNAVQAADVFFRYEVSQGKVFINGDQFNSIAFRSKNVAAHTWRATSDELKERAEIYATQWDFCI